MHRKRAAKPLAPAVCGDLAAVAFDNVLYDKQTEARAFCFRVGIRYPVKSFEHPFKVGRRNADAIVSNYDRNPVIE
jgi:hypothetical protein